MQVKADLNQILKEVNHALELMGSKRDTPAEQARFLIDIAMNFQKIVTNGLDAKYREDCFDNMESLRIATLIVNGVRRFQMTSPRTDTIIVLRRRASLSCLHPSPLKERII